MPTSPATSQKLEGGLRTRPNYRPISEDASMPTVTLITVVYNAAHHIERTLQSIVNQSYAYTEYIVVDGGSTDGTVDILWQYNDYIDYWVSEPDNGLYFAMNKALELGTGDYVWFINAGDAIYDLDTLTDVFASHKQRHEVYYGDTLMIDADGNEIGPRRLSPPEQLSWHDMQWGQLVSHQSFIVDAKLAYNYNTNFQFSADYDWMVRVLRNAKSVHNTRMVLSRYMDGGLTKRNIKAGLKERWRIMRKNYGWWRTTWNHFLMSFRFGSYLARHKRF